MESFNIEGHAQDLANHCCRVLDLGTARLSDEYFYQSLPLCVIDAVFSIGVNYEGTKSTVKRYCNYSGLQRIRSNRESMPVREAQESIREFLNKVRRLGISRFTNDVLDNRQRTSARNGILKSEAAVKFAEALERHGVNYLQDVSNVLTDEKFEREIRSIQGQRSGLSLRYFFMLAGSDDTVKPDRHIKSFIREAARVNINDQVAQHMLTRACEILKSKYPHLTPRVLDNTIWRYQRNRKKSGGASIRQVGGECNRASNQQAANELSGGIMNEDLERKFHEEMLAIYYKAGRETGYWANRFLQKVRKDGGLRAAKAWLWPEKGLTPGLQRLAREKRLDLSMEALIIEEPWKRLFTKDEIKEAKRRLEAASRLQYL